MISKMLSLCAERNGSVRRCVSGDGEISLDAFVEQQADKVRENRKSMPLRDPEDYFAALHAHAASLLGEETAAEITRTVRESRAICTADHHGALFSSQSFQGDLLYARLLEKLGVKTGTVPIMAAGQVELENASYARGICAYTSPDEKQLFPLFPAKYSVTLASHAPSVSAEMTERFRKRFVCGEGRDGVALSPALAEALDTVLKKGFEAGETRSAARFGDQVTRMGASLSGEFFADKGPVLAYLENEEIIRPLLIKELREQDSLIRRLICEPEARRVLAAEEAGEEGVSFGALLFRSVDEKGRKILLDLKEDGMLIGRDWHGQEVRYPSEPGELIRLLEERTVFPGTFTLALLTFFERGITWLGGMFQSCYLPEWQESFLRLLKECGFTREAEVMNYDTSGYISGPMFALYRADGFANGAGPVEFIMKKPACKRLGEMMRAVNLRDAHLIGLSEMYFDLVLREEREDNWYRNAALETAQRFSGGETDL